MNNLPFTTPVTTPVSSAGTTGNDAWQATRLQTTAATQILGDQSGDAAPKSQAIGRRTAPGEHELFVSCAPHLAMQQQFEHLRPEFIAVHDIATGSSGKLLASIAAASNRAVQRLVIRRQGYGTPLATIEFVELPTPESSGLRMYSTEADADTAARHGLARVLLGFSRLGVMMVGDLPGHAIATVLKPFREQMLAGPWPNRQLLLLPLAAASTLVAQGIEMAHGTGVNVRTTPQVTRPADAWGFINGTWARLSEPALPQGRATPSVARGTTGADTNAVAPTPGAPGWVERRGPDRLEMRPMPAVPSAAMRSAQPRGVLEHYVQQLVGLPGMVSCCVFEVASGLEVAHAGASPGASDLAMHGKALLAGMAASSRGLGLGHKLPEAAITLHSHHLLLRGVPGHAGLALHAALDKAHANLTLARLQVQRMDSILEGTTASRGHGRVGAPMAGRPQ